MRIAVIAALEAGASLAHAINTIKMAEGFAKNGHEVHLITLCGTVKSRQELDEFYGLKTFFHWHRFPASLFGVIPLRDKELFWFRIKRLVKSIEPDFVYCRNYVSPCGTAGMRIPTVAETHAYVGSEAPTFLRMLRVCQRNDSFRGIVTISEVLREYYASKGVPKCKVVVLPDAVDIELFSPPSMQTVQFPKRYASSDRANIVYAGHLYDYKGIPTVLRAAKRMQECVFHLVGGLSEDIARHRHWVEAQGLSNVQFHGLLPLSAVPSFLWCADALLLPPSGNHPSAQWTSPVKLGEYCASKRQIIASDIPALRAWLTEDEVIFFEADDVGSLCNAIGIALDPANTKIARKRVDSAYNLALDLSYENRAKHILNFAGLPTM